MFKNFSNYNSSQLFVILFSIFVLGAGIWSPSVITQGDESDYIRSSQEMLNSGELLTPTLRGQLRFTKPPLLYWMVVSSYKTFGVSLFSARLPVMITGVLIVLFVYKLGLVLFDRNAALISSLFCATTFGMIKFSKIVLMDIPLTLLMVMSLFYFVLYYTTGKRWTLLLSFTCLGISSLLKSPVYPAICVAGLALFLCIQFRWRTMFSREAVGSLALLVLITIPWYVAMVMHHGTPFTDYYINEHVEKFFVEKHYFFRVWIGLLLYMLPWSLFFIFAVVQILRDRLYKEWEYRLLGIWILLFLIVFLFPNQKGHYYAIPITPFCALITGAIFSRMNPSIKKVCERGTAIILLLPACTLFWAMFLLQPTSTLLFFITASLLVASMVSILKKKVAFAAVLYGCAMGLLYTALLPSVNFAPIPVVEARTQLKANTQIFTYRISPVLFANSLDRQIKEIRDARTLKQSLKKGGAVIIKEGEFPDLPTQTKILMSWQRWRHRIPVKEVLDKVLQGKVHELQEKVLLVTGKDGLHP